MPYFSNEHRNHVEYMEAYDSVMEYHKPYFDKIRKMGERKAKAHYEHLKAEVKRLYKEGADKETLFQAREERNRWHGALSNYPG